MSFISNFNHELHSSNWEFDEMTNRAYDFQTNYNAIYTQWVNKIGVERYRMQKMEFGIPFLPISFFKSKNIQSGIWKASSRFTSSGTTSRSTSFHDIYSNQYYNAIVQMGFEQFYGPVNDYQILALLPSYFEQPSSSLLHMIDHFINLSALNGSCYILEDMGNLDFGKLIGKSSKKLLLWGVSYALLDLLESQQCVLPKGSIILETGGMKGRRKELSKESLHSILKNGFKVNEIHSEYGMTELCSQAYSKGEGLFYPSRTMKVFVNEINDPLNITTVGRGQLNIIDLANIHSCCFIQTEDVGEVFGDGSFKVYGRLDNSLLRGCNMLHP